MIFSEAYDIVPIKNCFTNLESLTLQYISLEAPDQSLFSECKNVTSFEINGCGNIYSAITLNDFPNLEYLRFDDIDIRQNSGFRKFLMNKTKLKSICIEEIDYNIEWITKIIKENSNRVEKTMLKTKCGWHTKTWLGPLTELGSINIINLQCARNREEAVIFFNKTLDGSMESLAHLEITGINNDMISTIANFRNLQCLQLSDVNKSAISVNVNLEPLGKLRKLFVFKLKGHLNISVDGLIDFVTGADKLMTLNLIVMNFKLVSESYEKITEVVHKRNQTVVISIDEAHFDFEQMSRTEFIYIERDVSGI